MSDTQAHLNAKLAELEDRVARLEHDQRRADGPISQDFAEQATQRENDDVVDELLRESRLELTRVRQALARLAAGQYGTCVKCGGAIGDARLAAMPETTVCIGCAS